MTGSCYQIYETAQVTVSVSAAFTGPKIPLNAALSAMSASLMVTGNPRSTRLVTPCSLMPQGMIPPKCERSDRR